MTPHQFSRRTVLLGVGVTMALPWMESLGAWGVGDAASPRTGVKFAHGRRLVTEIR